MTSPFCPRCRQFHGERSLCLSEVKIETPLALEFRVDCGGSCVCFRCVMERYEARKQKRVLA
jgi:hypothetical protein